MKKLIMLIAILAAVVSAKAAMVDWKVPGSVDQVGSTVYLLTSIGDYENAEALAAAAVSSATIDSAGRGKYATPETTAQGSAVTKDASFFYAIVAADGKSFNYVDASILANSVYNPDAQESSPGVYEGINASAITAGTSKSFGGNPPPGPTPVDTPEPTSGLLLLVGGAALALRRKQK